MKMRQKTKNDLRTVTILNFIFQCIAYNCTSIEELMLNFGKNQ